MENLSGGIFLYLEEGYECVLKCYESVKFYVCIYVHTHTHIYIYIGILQSSKSGIGNNSNRTIKIFNFRIFK